MNSRLLSPVLHNVNNCQTDDNIQNVRTSSKYHRAEGSKPKVLGCFGFGYLVWTLSSPVFQLYPKITPNSKLPINHPLFRTTHKSPFIPNTYTHTQTHTHKVIQHYHQITPYSTVDLQITSYSTQPTPHPSPNYSQIGSYSTPTAIQQYTHSVSPVIQTLPTFCITRYSTRHTFCFTSYSTYP